MRERTLIRGRRGLAGASAVWRWVWMGAVWLGVSGGRAGDDWPMHRADSGRTSFRQVSLSLPLSPAWSHEAPAPRPAWGPPARGSYWQRLDRLEPRVADDHVAPAVLAGGTVVLGSPTDDRVRCLDAGSGRVRWAFWTDGPVRYAPVLADGRAHFGSDDGWVYAVALGDGRLLWRHRAGPEDWRIPGNGRLISSWPVRAGLLVEGGVVYGAAGLYPQQGTFAFALDAATGSPRWQAPLTESPEGHLLATGDMLLVPTGRASPIALDRGSGRFLRTLETGGGTYAVVRGTEVFGGPGNTGSLTGVEAPSGQRLVSVSGRNLVAAGERVFLLESGRLKSIDRARQAALELRARTLVARLRPLQEGLGKPDLTPAERAERTRAVEEGRRELDGVHEALAGCVTWTVPCSEDLCLIGAGEWLVVGGTNRVAAYEASTGRRVWDAPARGRVLALAAAEGRLVASTDLGVTQAFAAVPGSPRSPEAGEGGGAAAASADAAGGGAGGPGVEAARVREGMARLRAAGLPVRGWALVAGLGSGRWVEALLRTTEMGVVVVDPDAGRVAAVRAAWDAHGWYGTRVAVHAVPAGRLPFTDFFANLVLSESALEGGGSVPYSDEELARVLRPSGGVSWWVRGEEPRVRGSLEGAGEWTHQFGNPSNTANSGDRRVHADLRLQWFGGPGPDVMVDRHLRGPAPLSAGGRLFVPGENRLLAVDAYNGTTLWERELPGSQRYSMPYDAGYQSVDGGLLAVAVGGECWLLSAADGEVAARRPVPLPVGAGGGAWHWGYVALRGEGLFGTVQRSTASRTQPSYALIDADYNNDQPVVTGLGVFRLDTGSGRLVWRRESGAVLNTSITLHGGRVVFVEARGAGAVGHATGRMSLPEFLAADPWLVALQAESGEVAWQVRLEGDIAASRNVLYVQGAGDRLVLSGSRLGEGRDSAYRVQCRSLADGLPLWEASHGAGKPGEFTHGEQVHHPVVLGDLLVAEPVTYALDSGRCLPAPGGEEAWRLIRPGHSCGTLSGAGDCVFFRANNPTVLDVRESLRTVSAAPRKLAPSRTGCWINMIPAAGLLLVPEASAGCVCQYSLQTSMAFLPRPRP